MLEYIIWLVLAIIVVIVLWIVFSKVLAKTKVQDSTSASLSFDINSFMDALGGIENIKESEATLSKVTVYLHDEKIVNMAKLKELGASGVVQSNDKVTIILGKVSKEISNKIRQLK